jgi:hypothetical protein
MSCYSRATENYPVTALSFGDGTNNYGWVSNDTMVYANIRKNTTHFLTIQALQGSAWKPITNNLAVQASNNEVQSPKYLPFQGLSIRIFLP